MLKHSKRYLIVLNEWGAKEQYGSKHATPKSWFRCSYNEFDTLEEVNDGISLINEMFEEVYRPDIVSNVKYKSSTYKNGSVCNDIDKYNYIYDDNHFFWGYAVLDFENEKVVTWGGAGLQNYARPDKSLSLLDIYFRGDNEVPKDYVWQPGEYEGWLQFRWGDGKNAIGLPQPEDNPIKPRPKSKFAKPMSEKEIEEMLNYGNNEPVIINEEYDS